MLIARSGLAVDSGRGVPSGMVVVLDRNADGKGLIHHDGLRRIGDRAEVPFTNLQVVILSPSPEVSRSTASQYY